MENLTTYLVPFAAGNLIYIAGSDLILELHAEEELGRTLLQLALILCSGLLLLFIGQLLE